MTWLDWLLACIFSFLVAETMRRNFIKMLEIRRQIERDRRRENLEYNLQQLRDREVSSLHREVSSQPVLLNLRGTPEETEYAIDWHIRRVKVLAHMEQSGNQHRVLDCEEIE